MQAQAPGKPWSPHVRFAALPKPDHRTGQVTHTIASPRPIHLRTPAFGVISQRRVCARDERGDQYVLEAFQSWREDNPEDELPNWKELRWIEDPHPGSRVLILLDEYGGSPTSDGVPTSASRTDSSGLEHTRLNRIGSEFFEHSSIRSSSTFTPSRYDAEVCCKIQ